MQTVDVGDGQKLANLCIREGKIGWPFSLWFQLSKREPGIDSRTSSHGPLKNIQSPRASRVEESCGVKGKDGMLQMLVKRSIEDPS